MGWYTLPEFGETNDHFQLERIRKQFMKMARELGGTGRLATKGRQSSKSKATGIGKTGASTSTMDNLIT